MFLCFYPPLLLRTGKASSTSSDELIASYILETIQKRNKKVTFEFNYSTGKIKHGKIKHEVWNIQPNSRSYNDKVQKLKKNKRKIYKYTNESRQDWKLRTDLKYGIITKNK